MQIPPLHNLKNSHSRLVRQCISVSCVCPACCPACQYLFKLLVKGYRTQKAAATARKGGGGIGAFTYIPALSMSH